MAQDSFIQYLQQISALSLVIIFCICLLYVSKSKFTAEFVIVLGKAVWEKYETDSFLFFSWKFNFFKMNINWSKLLTFQLLGCNKCSSLSLCSSLWNKMIFAQLATSSSIYPQRKMPRVVCEWSTAPKMNGTAYYIPKTSLKNLRLKPYSDASTPAWAKHPAQISPLNLVFILNVQFSFKELIFYIGIGFLRCLAIIKGSRHCQEWDYN